MDGRRPSASSLRGGRGRPPVSEEEARKRPPEPDPVVREGFARADRYDDAAAEAQRALRDLRKLDAKAPRPNKPFDPDDLSESNTRQLQQYKSEAEARIKELSTIPGSNPSWGVNRLRKELNEQGTL